MSSISETMDVVPPEASTHQLPTNATTSSSNSCTAASSSSQQQSETVVTPKRPPGVHLIIKRDPAERNFKSVTALQQEVLKQKKINKSDIKTVSFCHYGPHCRKDSYCVLITTDNKDVFDHLIKDWPIDSFGGGVKVRQPNKEKAEQPIEIIIKQVDININFDSEEVKVELSNQGVIKAVRIISSTGENKGKPTETVKLIMNNNDAATNLLNRHYFILDSCRYRTERSIKVPQCFNCQGLDHLSYKCPYEMVCVRCGESHRKESCTATTLFCYNCGGNHAACSRNCPVIKRQALKQPSKPSVIYAAIPPTTNAWQNKANQQHALIQLDLPTSQNQPTLASKSTHTVHLNTTSLLAQVHSLTEKVNKMSDLTAQQNKLIETQQATIITLQSTIASLVKLEDVTKMILPRYQNLENKYNELIDKVNQSLGGSNIVQKINPQTTQSEDPNKKRKFDDTSNNKIKSIGSAAGSSASNVSAPKQTPKVTQNQTTNLNSIKPANSRKSTGSTQPNNV